MKISIVTISYNQGQFLEETIKSVLAQTYTNFEYILIDGGSTDGSIEIIQKYAPAFSYWVCESDQGPAHALNKGFARATGELFYFLNSDDLILPDTFREIVEQVRKYPDYDVFYGHGFLIDAKSVSQGLILSDKWRLDFYAQGEISIVQPATFIKAESFWKTGGFNLLNRTCWDGELLVKLALTRASFKRLELFLCCFRIHPNSISGQSAKLKKAYLSDCKRIADDIQTQESISIYPRLVIKIFKLMTDFKVMRYRIYHKILSVVRPL